MRWATKVAGELCFFYWLRQAHSTHLGPSTELARLEVRCGYSSRNLVVPPKSLRSLSIPPTVFGPHGARKTMHPFSSTENRPATVGSWARSQFGRRVLRPPLAIFRGWVGRPPASICFVLMHNPRGSRTKDSRRHSWMANGNLIERRAGYTRRCARCTSAAVHEARQSPRRLGASCASG